MNLSDNTESQKCIVQGGGLGHVFQGLLWVDYTIKKATSELILVYTRGGLSREQLVDKGALRVCLSVMERMAKKTVYTHNTNGHVERCVIEYLASVCEVNTIKRELVTIGLMKCLVRTLAVEDLPREYSHLIVRGLQKLVLLQENQVNEWAIICLWRACMHVLRQ